MNGAAVTSTWKLNVFHHHFDIVLYELAPLLLLNYIDTIFLHQPIENNPPLRLQVQISILQRLQH